MKKHFLVTCAALALALPSQAQDYPSLSLKMAHPLAQTFPGAEWDKWFAEEIEKRSGGKIKIQIFWSGQLGGLTEIKNLVGNGAVDIGVFAQAVHAAELPLTSVSAGLLNRVSADAKTGSELARASYATKAVTDELQAQNLKVIKWTVPSPYKLLCNKPVNTSADLKGLKVRAVGGAYVPIWMEAHGMVPTRVQATEIREGLQRGTLDCNFGPIEWTPFSDLQKVAPYLSDLNTGSFTTFQMYVPAKVYNAWPKSVQTLFTQVAQEAMQKDLAALPKVEADAMDKFKATGGSVVQMKDLQNFIARSPDMIQIWVDKSTKDGQGEKIKELVPLQRKAAQSFANARN
jgi:TRAP-type C4-dicarboxylate transport system substrate-binding protein